MPMREPGGIEHVGRTATDNRQFVNGDLPERYG
jgi:hypothetical protein